jgi:hypothetical protein
MAAPTKPRPTRSVQRPAGGTPKLPPVTVAKFEEAGKLIERLVEEHTDVFISAQQRYRDLHRDATRRPLNPDEAAMVATAMAEAFGEGDLAAAAARVQASDLHAYDDPDSREVLLAAGAATAPAFIAAARRVVALIEMPNDRFAEACEGESLDEAVDTDAEALLLLGMIEARARAADALAHFADAAGVAEGNVWGLLVDTVWQPLVDTITAMSSPGRSSSLTGSPPSTDGPIGTSSTGSATGEPSS